MGYTVKYLALLSYANVMFLFSRLILDFETSHDLREVGFLPAMTRSLAYDFRSSITTHSADSAGFLLFTGTTSATHALRIANDTSDFH